MRTGLSLPRSTVGVTRWRRFRATVDWPLILTVAAICAVGLLNLYSATHGTRHAGKFDRQLTWMGVGAIAFFGALIADYRTLVRGAWIALGTGVFMLIVVRLLGDLARANGSSRWLNLGSAGGQPSELAKIAVILVAAKILQDAEVARLRWTHLLLRGAALMVPVVLIAVQPDLGTATLVVLIILSIGFLAMPSIWPMVHVTLAGLLAFPILWESMHWYQKQRVLAFLDPSADPTGSGWHTRQSIFAVGSGMVTGKGYMQGTQNQFDFLPEHWTDFPYSVWAEEWGFLGSAGLVILYSFLILWIVGVALSARDRAGAVVCIGVAAMTFWHMVVNIAMVLGLAPVVGVTLPFVSYGGSSLLTFFIGMGMVASVSLRKHGY